MTRTPFEAPRRRVSAALPPVTARQLDEMAKADGLTATEVLIRAISLMSRVSEERAAGRRLFADSEVPDTGRELVII